MPNKHHAHLLVGSISGAKVYLNGWCEELGFVLKNNPDFINFDISTFGIEEARQLREFALRQAFNDCKVFLVSALHFTPEAQNALLKTFEEPIARTYFFVVAREEAQIIPTLLSRMQVTRLENAEPVFKDAQDFLSLSLKDRLLFVKMFVEEERSLVSFLDELLLLLKSKDQREFLKKLYQVRRLVSSSTPSPRLALEHLSLVLA